MSQMEEIKLTLDKIANQHDIIVTDLIWHNSPNERVLEIPIMFKDGSMDLETCGIMSQLFIDALDDVKSLDFDYSIDVCSPGAERVLNSYDEIKQALNQHVYVKLIDPKAGFFEITGNLSEVSDESINIEYMEKTRKKNFEIAIDNIRLIRLAVKI